MGGAHALAVVELYPSLRRALLMLLDRLRDSTSSDRVGVGSAGEATLGSSRVLSSVSRAGNLAKRLRELESSPTEPTGGATDDSDIILGGSAQLFRRHCASGFLDKQILGTISGQSTGGGGGGGVEGAGGGGGAASAGRS